jgi:DNA repair ATPase RecN
MNTDTRRTDEAKFWHYEYRKIKNLMEQQLTAVTEQRDRLAEAQNILKQCLSAMPVGYIPTHTAENLPEMIGDLAKALAEETAEREKFEQELKAVTEQRDRLAEAMRVINTYDPVDGQCDDGYSPVFHARKALQSLTTNPQTSEKV